MTYFLKKIPFYISVALFIFVIMLFYLLYNAIGSNNEKTNQAIIETQNEINRREEIKLLNRSIDTLRASRNSIDRHFAPGSDIVPFLNTLESLARTSSIKGETSSVDVLKDGTGLSVRMNVVGSYSNIYKFLALLENAPYELEVSSINLQRESGQVQAAAEPQTQAGSGDENETSQTAAAPKISRGPEWRALFTIKLLSFVK